MISDNLIIAGTNTATYIPKGNKKYSLGDLINHLRKFQLSSSLEYIGKISHKYFFKKDNDIIKINDIPVHNSILAYFTLILIRNSNDYRKNQMSDKGFLTALDMFYGLPEPNLKEIKMEEFLIRSSYLQFPYTRQLRYLIPRTIVMYMDLWYKVPTASSIEIQKEIIKITGLTIDEILIMSITFSERAKNGSFKLYEESRNSPPKVALTFTKEKQQRFINWLKCNYSQFRKMLIQEQLPDISFDKYNFNPLITNPIIIPDKNPIPGSDTYILPVTRLLHERVTRGLYFELSNKLKGEGRANQFKTAFGYVFQEYVGLLLKKAINSEQILGDWEYGSDKMRTPDWIILENEKAIFIEVKQSGLFKMAKTFGEVKQIEDDISKTIADGVKQIFKFENNLKSDKYKELRQLTKVNEIERIVVTYDNCYYSNLLLYPLCFKIFKKENIQIPEDYHWHIISIDELENLLGIKDLNIFTLLKTKRNSAQYNIMDFREFLFYMYPNEKFQNVFLENTFDLFFNSFHLKIPKDK